MSGKATLTMNRSRLASTIPALTIARTWSGFVRLTAILAISTSDLRLTLRSPFALDDQSPPVPVALARPHARWPRLARLSRPASHMDWSSRTGRNGEVACPVVPDYLCRVVPREMLEFDVAVS